MKGIEVFFIKIPTCP